MRGKKDPWDYPPNHFLWFSKDVLRYFLHREGFGDILIVPVNISLGSLAQNIEYVITGSSFIRKKVKGQILRRMKNSAFLKFIITMKNAIFLPIALLFYKGKYDYHLYFQAKWRY